MTRRPSTRLCRRPPRRRILVVDDKRSSADSLGVLLRTLGQDVEMAYDGPSALGLIRSRRPDLVLLDIGLPGMDGYEVARRCREDGDLRRVMLVAMTGYGKEEDRRRSQEAGFNAHLVKPVNLEDLRVLLTQPDPMAPGAEGSGPGRGGTPAIDLDRLPVDPVRQGARQEEMPGDLQHHIDRHAIPPEDFGPLPFEPEDRHAPMIRAQRRVPDRDEVGRILGSPVVLDARQRPVQAGIVSVGGAGDADRQGLTIRGDEGRDGVR